MIRACIFDLGGTIVDRYSITPLLSFKKLFSKKNLYERYKYSNKRLFIVSNY